jgi:hypothetical protein
MLVLSLPPCSKQSQKYGRRVASELIRCFTRQNYKNPCHALVVLHQAGRKVSAHRLNGKTFMARELNAVNSHFRFVSGVRLEIAAQSAYSHQGDGDEYSHQYVSHRRSLGQAPTSAKSGSDWIHFCHAAPILLANSTSKELMRFIRPNLKNLRGGT